MIMPPLIMPGMARNYLSRRYRCTIAVAAVIAITAFALFGGTLLLRGLGSGMESPGFFTGIIRAGAIALGVLSALALAVLFFSLAKSRKKEFAILRRLGATRRKFIPIVFAETQALFLSGTITGSIAAAFAVCISGKYFGSKIGHPFLLPGTMETFQLVLFGLVISFIIGLAFASYYSVMVKVSTCNSRDPDFPYLSVNERFSFPSPENAKHESVVAWGGNLSPGLLLSAFEQGLFPWYYNGEPIIWHSPDPRLVIFPGKLHIPSNMKDIFKRKEFTIRLDTNFPAVIENCSSIERPGQDKTWISAEVIAAFTELHRLGLAHSVEAYSDGELAGGVYGIRLGNVFFSESMFALKRNASKAAFLTLTRFLFDEGVLLLDSQTPTNHLKSLGAEEISRAEFHTLLREILPPGQAGTRDDHRGSWTERWQEYEKR